MKKHAQVWCLLGLLSLAGAVAARADEAGGTTEKAIMALEDQWLKSEQTNNVDLTAPLLAERFVGTSEEGKVMNRTEYLAELKATSITSAANENVHVTVFGNTAIATGRWTGKGTSEKGKPFESHVQWTDTWVRMPDGKWRCVATQNSSIQK